MIRFTRRTALALPALLAAPAARAQADWPTRPIRIVAPFPPGGLADVMARPLAARMQAAWGQPAVVENRPGSGGNIGADVVAKAAPDGYTFLVGSIGPIAANEFLFASLPYNPRTAFAPIAVLATTPKVICVGAGKPWKSLAELTAGAKAEPGRITAGSAGNGSSLHLALELFNEAVGTRITHVPYRGAGPAVNDLIGGQIDCIFDNVPNILGQIRGERVRPLATLTAQRLPQLPDVPTIAEAGGPPLVFGAWFCLVAPAGTPAPVITRVSEQVDLMMRDLEVGGRLAAQGAVTGGGGPQPLAELIATTRTQLEPVIRRNNIRAE
ncbi:tripartite tricarboxylate transporter substrate binding protein [Falsiroseomonas bella]|uniref:Tripartite tricarboxylate transporter substrate binding protein n=1 Tax=Falsiroseomonas bella TaxID=2184016 RepID=A0A317FDV0_9PROT|nr:tripartite tricarboxylate transporter substrate binding protein [Falsiroseomonas bella]PWS35748.1 tripartite tricarboxylate transporter substrate binding protein [Falsiroseomonas bella]